MSVTSTIEAALEQYLQPTFIEIIDESYKHAGHTGAKDGGGHFIVNIVSKQFDGKSRIARHRMVHDATQHLFENKIIHALSIDAKTPEEARRNQIEES